MPRRIHRTPQRIEDPPRSRRLAARMKLLDGLAHLIGHPRSRDPSNVERGEADQLPAQATPTQTTQKIIRQHDDIIAATKRLKGAIRTEVKRTLTPPTRDARRLRAVEIPAASQGTLGFRKVPRRTVPRMRSTFVEWAATRSRSGASRRRLRVTKRQ
jgi:hypothetical protein